MRWDELFDDLEGQLEHELHAEDAGLRVEEERLRLGRLSLRGRLRAASGLDDDRAHPLTLWLRDGSTVRLIASTFGRDWMAGTLSALDGSGARGGASGRAIVPLDAVVSVVLEEQRLRDSLAAELDEDASRADVAPRLADRLGLAFALRDLARRRAGVTLSTQAGMVHGTIDRVARDHLDLAVHEPGLPRRADNVRGFRIVPLSALVLIRMA
ncbi:hypothetical protein [Humibacter ginsenosidimutans]|uniref:Uncharacterized protein n=1 Tax=Humibacter ginsenosidimutans TaxID=2599293 RepID=A0A5B8M7R4_9MICO|nr:hypothetical protein [Humibacter ginsenosidimutans]QDZ16473.1 hypothetical protein FPZ11_18510 [Humibacter ginsenosidimutans]